MAKNTMRATSNAPLPHARSSAAGTGRAVCVQGGVALAPIRYGRVRSDHEAAWNRLGDRHVQSRNQTPRSRRQRAGNRISRLTNSWFARRALQSDPTTRAVHLCLSTCKLTLHTMTRGMPAFLHAEAPGVLGTQAKLGIEQARVITRRANCGERPRRA